jgi:hypothetical protein
MNRKQFIAMWGGIAAIVLAGLNVIWYYGLVHLYGFLTWIFIVALVTSSLMYSLKGSANRKMKNAIQDIRGTLLKKKQSRIRTGDYDRDKQLVHSGSQI